jgi:hypothetical protein
MSCELVDDAPEYGVVVKADLADNQVQDLAENVSDAFAAKTFDKRRLLALDDHEAAWLRRLVSVVVSGSFGAQSVNQQSTNQQGTGAGGSTTGAPQGSATTTGGAVGSTGAAPSPSPTVTATATVTVGSFSTAQSMASSSQVNAAFRTAMATSTGIPAGNVAVVLTASPRRLREETEAAIRRLAATLSAAYTMVVPAGMQASSVAGSLQQNTMASTLGNALVTALASTPFANVSVAVTGIANVVATTPNTGNPVTTPEMSAADSSQGVLVLVSALLAGLLW